MRWLRLWLWLFVWLWLWPLCDGYDWLISTWGSNISQHSVVKPHSETDWEITSTQILLSDAHHFHSSFLTSKLKMHTRTNRWTETYLFSHSLAVVDKVHNPITWVQILLVKYYSTTSESCYTYVFKSTFSFNCFHSAFTEPRNSLKPPNESADLRIRETCKSSARKSNQINKKDSHCHFHFYLCRCVLCLFHRDGWRISQTQLRAGAVIGFSPVRNTACGQSHLRKKKKKIQQLTSKLLKSNK